jgi:MFS family permease
VRHVADLVRGRRDLQAFLVANALWELALSALKTFLVLYVTKTLGLSLAGSSLAIGAAPLVAFGGGVTMSVPYALLMPMMPRGAHGAVTGLYSLSRGVGTSLGPLLAGVAIEAAGEDYRWTWLVCGAAILVSISVMAPLRDDR